MCQSLIAILVLHDGLNKVGVIIGRSIEAEHLSIDPVLDQAGDAPNICCETGYAVGVEFGKHNGCTICSCRENQKMGIGYDLVYLVSAFLRFLADKSMVDDKTGKFLPVGR